MTLPRSWLFKRPLVRQELIGRIFTSPTEDITTISGWSKLFVDVPNGSFCLTVREIVRTSSRQWVMRSPQQGSTTVSRLISNLVHLYGDRGSIRQGRGVKRTRNILVTCTDRQALSGA